MTISAPLNCSKEHMFSIEEWLNGPAQEVDSALGHGLYHLDILLDGTASVHRYLDTETPDVLETIISD